MAYQSVFQRYEIKYLITSEQKQRLVAEMAPYMALDQYGRTIIRNIYFDTPDFRLIRNSIEKPPYKEKLRLRSYEQTSPDTPVFVEIKKKYDSIVYKRRIALSESGAMNWICGTQPVPFTDQISREIDYFLSFYPELRPTVFISYAREAYFCRSGNGFRITFDDDILCRRHDLSLGHGPAGSPILANDLVLMEIKCSGGIPLWMTKLLTQERIFRTSFSKYGTAYQKLIYPNLQGGYQHA